MVAAFFVRATLISSPLAAQVAAKQSPGVEFDMKTSMTVSGGMPGMADMAPNYSAHGVALGARLRIDLVEGALPPLAQRGDYILFDTSGITVVHPGKKDYVKIPNGASTKFLDQLQAMGMSVKVGDISAAVDLIPGTDTVAGFPTRHYKMTLSSTMTIEGMGASQQLKSQTASEYWNATIPGLAVSPLELASKLNGGNQMGTAAPSSGPFKELSAKADSVTRRMTGTAVRIKLTTRSGADAVAATGDVVSELSNVKHAPVADSMFVVPADYTRAPSPVSGD